MLLPLALGEKHLVGGRRRRKERGGKERGGEGKKGAIMYMYMYMYKVCPLGDCSTSRPEGRSLPRELWFLIFHVQSQCPIHVHVHVHEYSGSSLIRTP